MNKLFFLNGATYCGKTSTGRSLLDICENMAFIELDDLHGFIPWMPIERAVAINISNGISVDRNFIKENKLTLSAAKRF